MVTKDEREEWEDIFDERKAIEMAIQDLKEQTRMDFDLYFESRKIRTEQISILLSRLRELDERDNIVQIKYRKAAERVLVDTLGSLDTIVEEEEAKKARLLEERALERQRQLEKREQEKLEEKRKLISESIQKEKLVSKPQKAGHTYVPIERVETLVLAYLEQNGEQPLRKIKEYVEEQTGASWKNFSEVVRKIKANSSSIEYGDVRGYYRLNKQNQ